MQCVVSGNVGACSEITNDMRRHRFVVRRTPTRTLHFSRFILSYGGPFLHVTKVSNDLASHREMKRAGASENEPCRCVTANACLHKRVIKVPTIGKRAPLFSNRWKTVNHPPLSARLLNGHGLPAIPIPLLDITRHHRHAGLVVDWRWLPSRHHNRLNDRLRGIIHGSYRRILNDDGRRRRIDHLSRGHIGSLCVRADGLAQQNARHETTRSTPEIILRPAAASLMRRPPGPRSTRPAMSACHHITAPDCTRDDQQYDPHHASFLHDILPYAVGARKRFRRTHVYRRK